MIDPDSSEDEGYETFKKQSTVKGEFMDRSEILCSPRKSVTLKRKLSMNSSKAKAYIEGKQVTSKFKLFICLLFYFFSNQIQG